MKTRVFAPGSWNFWTLKLIASWQMSDKNNGPEYMIILVSPSLHDKNKSTPNFFPDNNHTTSSFLTQLSDDTPQLFGETTYHQWQPHFKIICLKNRTKSMIKKRIPWTENNVHAITNDQTCLINWKKFCNSYFIHWDFEILHSVSFCIKFFSKTLRSKLHFTACHTLLSLKTPRMCNNHVFFLYSEKPPQLYHLSLQKLVLIFLCQKFHPQNNCQVQLTNQNLAHMIQLESPFPLV